MLADPSLYNISNWLTSGIPDTAKGTLFPDKPFSPEHWLNSFEMASLLMGSLKLAQSRAAMFDPKGRIDGAGRGSGDVGIGAGKQSAKHAVGNAKQAQSVLDGIDPKYFNQQSRFGGGFYVGADGNTIVAELAEHGNTAKYAISYDLDLSGQKVLDLTNPQIASSWNYVPKLTSTNACQAIGETARVQGYSVVIFQSYRGEGYNYVIFNSFDKILSPRMIVPID